MMNWLEEIDKDLYTLRCNENLIYYYQDIGEIFDKKKLCKVSEARRELLTQKSLMSKVRKAKKHEEYLIRRKAELLERAIISSNIEYDPILLEIKNEIDEKQHQFDSSSVYKTLSHSSNRKLRKDIYISQLPHLKPIENLFRQFVTRANLISQRLGFSDYIDAKFYIEESSFKETSTFMSYSVKETEEFWKEFIQGAKNQIGNTLEPYDLDFFIKQKLERLTDKHFEKEEILNTLSDTLSSFGVKYSELPISIEIHNLPYVGACYPLKVREDIRFILNPSEGYAYYKALFHEFGHAIYYCFCPLNSEILIDNQIMREIMADIWKGIVESREWLEKFSNLSSIEVDNIIKSRELYRALWTRPLIREFLFEVEIFKTEQQEFSNRWNKITSDLLFVSDATGIYSDWDFSHSLDIKNYVLSAFVKDVGVDYLKKQFSCIMQKSVFDFLVENFYKPGNIIPYKEKLKNIGWRLW